MYDAIEDPCLRLTDYLRNLDTQTFAGKAAHFLAELNAIHAFREGNGRSQLTFFVLLADHAGHPLNIEKLEPDEMLAAMIASSPAAKDCSLP